MKWTGTCLDASGSIQIFKMHYSRYVFDFHASTSEYTPCRFVYPDLIINSGSLLSLTGDLGVQRGMLRWFLGLHSPTHSFSFSPDKNDRNVEIDPVEDELSDEEVGSLPNLMSTATTSTKSLDATRTPPFDLSSIPPAPLATPTKADSTGSQSIVASLPPPVTPSLEQTLMKVENLPDYVPPPLPAGLSTSTLQARLDGKKKIK